MQHEEHRTVARRRHGPERPRPWVTWSARAALSGALLVALVLTLTPDAPFDRLLRFHGQLGRLVEHVSVGQTQLSLVEAEALANVLLFIPIGLLLRFALPAVPSTVLLLVATAGSLGIEVAQYALLPARTPSLVDVLTNGGGAAIGLVLGADLERLARRDDPVRRP